MSETQKFRVHDLENKKNHNGIKNRYDVIIIGSGPAGYAPGIYTSRAKLKTLLITGTLPGGQTYDYKRS